LKKSLAVEAREVLCCDPFIDEPWITPLDEALERAQVFFVGAPHSAYRKTSFRGKPVIDIWHATSEGISVL